MSHQSAFHMLISLLAPLVTSPAGVNWDLSVQLQTYFKRQLFLYCLTQFVNSITNRSARMMWLQTCAALGRSVRVKEHVKRTAEDRWPVSVTVAGIYLASPVGVMEVVWTKGIQECSLILCILGSGLKGLWKTILEQERKNSANTERIKYEDIRP